MAKKPKILVYVKTGRIRTRGSTSIYETQGQLKAAITRTADNNILRVRGKNAPSAQNGCWNFHIEDLIICEGSIEDLPIHR